MLRDGMHQSAIHTGQAPYRPNSIDDGEPHVADAANGGYVPTARPIEYDALVVAAGTTPVRDIKLILLLQEAFRHCKPVAAWGDGTAGIDLDAPGVLVADGVDKTLTSALATVVGVHRVWERAVDVMASEVAPAR